jgi:hypothetical protein
LPPSSRFIPTASRAKREARAAQGWSGQATEGGKGGRESRSRPLLRSLLPIHYLFLRGAGPRPRQYLRSLVPSSCAPSQANKKSKTGQRPSDAGVVSLKRQGEGPPNHSLGPPIADGRFVHTPHSLSCAQIRKEFQLLCRPHSTAPGGPELQLLPNPPAALRSAKPFGPPGHIRLSAAAISTRSSMLP